MSYTVKHPHYSDPDRFSALALSAFRALVRKVYDTAGPRRHAAVWYVPAGQYLLLHKVKDGEYYIPILVHVKKSYSGPEAYLHPIPPFKDVSDALKVRGVHTPYGIAALRVLTTALNEGKVSPRSMPESFVLERIGTRRSKLQIPAPEYADQYLAGKILQEVAPDSDEYVLNGSRVFVLDYHIHDGEEFVRLEPYDRSRHGPVDLKTVWPEGEKFHPVARVDPDTFRDVHTFVRRGGQQAHF